MALEQLQFLEKQIGKLDQEWPVCSTSTQDAVERARGSSRAGSGFSATIIAEVVPPLRPFLLQNVSLLGWSVPWRRRERRREHTAIDPEG